MSVPSAFAPVQEGGRLLVDGGLTRNLPVDVVRDLCADVVIAVNIGSPLLKEEEMQSLLGVAAQMVNILMEDNVRRSLAQLRPRDILIAPDLAQLGSGDFAKGVNGIPAGERAARETRPRWPHCRSARPITRSGRAAAASGASGASGSMTSALPRPVSSIRRCSRPRSPASAKAARSTGAPCTPICRG